MNSGPSERSAAVAMSARIHASAAARGSASPLTSTSRSGQSSPSAGAERGPSAVSVKRRAKVCASSTVRRSAVSKSAVSTGPWISTYSAVL